MPADTAPDQAAAHRPRPYERPAPSHPLLDLSVPVPATLPPTTLPSAKPTAQTGRRRLALPLAALVIITVAITASVWALIAHSGTTTHATKHGAAKHGAARSTPAPVASSAPAVPADLAAASRWLSQAVPHDATVVAAPSAGAALRSAGFTSVRTDGEAAGPAQWLVVDKALRDDAASAALLQRSAAVAQFGSGANGVEVRWLTSGTPHQLQAMLAADSAARIAAGTQLSANPAVTATPSTREQLRAGQLDLRATTFLALLAASTRVDVAGITSDPAEQALHRPARSVTVSGVDVATLRRTVAMFPASSRPVLTTTGTASTLTWAVAVDPVRPVS